MGDRGLVTAVNVISTEPIAPSVTHHPLPITTGGEQRQPQREGAALALHALDGDRAAVLGDDLLGPGQPDSGAGNVPLHVAAATEAVEDVGQIGRGDAQTVIL